MKISQNELIDLKMDIHEIVKHLYKMKESDLTRSVTRKPDDSLVTSIDIAISNLFENFCHNKNLSLISEENINRERPSYPIAVLDPIDGTRELVEGLPECCVSFSIYYGSMDDPRNFSWLYNPFTGFELSSHQMHINSNKRRNTRLLGLVSNSEFEAGLYQDIKLKDLDVLNPRGSIAFKLGLLAIGACDFVVSQRGKNIWDILAGTHLCNMRGIYMFYNGEKLTSFDEIRIDAGVLMWCPPDRASLLNACFLK